MIFTGKNLETVRDALERASIDVRSDINSAPEIDEEDLLIEDKRYRKLLKRVELKLKEETR